MSKKQKVTANKRLNFFSCSNELTAFSQHSFSASYSSYSLLLLFLFSYAFSFPQFLRLCVQSSNVGDNCCSILTGASPDVQRQQLSRC